ncbi:MAG TPA: hypothetical protein VIN08_14585 [Ohtaekwangia sp.]|uniref:hypothetical protein n=1 Tax=Ohtaekwangia sp. TaxID=2066019 RepID=UPI002F921D43
MNPIFKKLNYKDQKLLHIISAPDSFKKDVHEMGDLANIKTSLAGAKSVAFLLAFVTKQKEVNDLTNKVTPLIEDDGIIWFAYPKGTSKKYTCEFNRDNGWEELGKHGFEPVRMVAIDEDWSALRFRKAEHIKTMTRSTAISVTGKAKIATKKSAKK